MGTPQMAQNKKLSPKYKVLRNGFPELSARTLFAQLGPSSAEIDG